MKHHSFPALLSLFLFLSGCSAAPVPTPSSSPAQTSAESISMTLSDQKILADGQLAVGMKALNAYTILVYSSPQLDAQEYTLAQTASVMGEDLGGLVTSVQSTGELHALGYSQTTLGRGMRPPGGAFVKEENPQTDTAEGGHLQSDGQTERDQEPPADMKKPEEGSRPIPDRQG